MFTNIFTGGNGAKLPRTPRTVASVAAGTLVLTMLTATPVAAAEVPDDILNVSFAGGFTSTEEGKGNEYVKAGDEKIAGKLERRSDTLSISDEHAAVFNTSFAGLTFTPTNEQLLTDATVSKAPGNKAFRAEMIFTPETNQRSEGTLFSAGGNFFVVHLNGKMRYGFSSFDANANPRWGKHYQEVDWPAANEKHVLRVTYKPDSNEKMLVSLDGNDLPAVTSEKQFATHDQARHLIGFGHEVHPGTANTDRGFKGTIEAIRVLPDDDTVKFSFKLPGAQDEADSTDQPPANTGATEPAETPDAPSTPAEEPAAPTAPAEILDVTFNGTLSTNTYTAGEGETVAGSLATKAGSERVADDKVTLSGTDTGLTYTLNGDNPLSTSTDGLTLNKPVRAEMIFTPNAEQPELATLFAAGGNMFVRYQDGQIRYGFDSFDASRQRRWQGHTQNMSAPEAGKAHLLRVEYLPTETGTTMKVSIDGTAGPDVVAEGNYSRMSDQAKKTVGFGREVNPGGTSPQRGFAGTVDAIRLVPENGTFKLELPQETPAQPGGNEEPPQTTPGEGEQPGAGTGEEPSTPPAAEDGKAKTTSELLNVTFGGSLVGTDQYTTQEDDVMNGNLRGASGQEKQTPSNVALGGGRQGLNFTAENFTLGTDRITNSFVMEAVFVPKGDQADLGTLLAAGGNFSVRYKGGAFSYGWDHNTPQEPRRWQKPSHSVPAPTTGKEHVVSIHHRVAENGKVTLDVMLDGDKLQSVESSHGANIAGGRASLFAFGNDVHPAALERGFIGDIKKVRVAATDGGETTRELFAYQPQPNSEDLFHTSWAGTLAEGAYTKAEPDIMLGTANAHGTPAVTAGNLVTANGDDAVAFVPTAEALAKLQNKGFIVETTFTPNGVQADGATIVEVGGKFFARYKGGKLEYGYVTADGEVVQQAAFKPEATHVLSLAYMPTEGGATLTAWLDRVALNPISNPAVMVKGSDFGKAVFGNTLATGDAAVFNGAMGESRYAVLNGPHQAKDFRLQVLDEVCADISDIAPANYIAVSEDDCQANIIKKAALVRPTEKQAVWQEEGLTAFIHYGINTYTRSRNGNEIGIEWGHGDVPASQFNPTGDLNPDAWVKTLRDNGYRTTILVLKHHDGFMTWPTRYSEYSIKNSPWKNGQGNILREFTDAAHKYGMKVGVYISPADSHEEERPGGTHGNKSESVERTIPTLVPGDDREGKIPADKTFTYTVDDYDHFFLNTLYELLTEYGEVHEVWFDGAAGNTRKKEYYDYGIYFDMISKLQPGANVAVGGRDIRWIGNEHGEGRFNEWSPLPITGDPAGKISLFQPGGPFNQNLGSDQQLIDAVRARRGVQNLHWWPGEADMKLTGGWFAHHDRNGRNTDTPKSPATLMRHYEETVGRNSVMLLNVPPTVEGTFTQRNVDAIAGFAAERRKAYTLDHALGLPVTIGDVTTKELTNGNVRDGIRRAADDLAPMEIDLGAPKTVTRVGISEDILDAGQVVRSFKIEALRGSEWATIAESGVIGAQRIVKLNRPETAQKFRITVTSTRADYVISNFQLYGQLDADPGLARDAYIDCSADRAGVGTAESPFNSLEQLRKHELAPGSDLYFKAGVNCEDANITVWAYGTDSDKVELKTWGEGGAPTIGGQALKARFAKYAAQGWDVESAPVEPQPTAALALSYVDDQEFTGTVKRGENLRFTVTGVPANSEVQFWVHSDPQKVATVTANEAGEASADWTAANVEDGAHTVYARSANGDDLASQPLNVAGDQPAGGDSGSAEPGTGDDSGAGGTEPGSGDGGSTSDGDGAGAQPGTGEQPSDGADTAGQPGNTGDEPSNGAGDGTSDPGTGANGSDTTAGGTETGTGSQDPAGSGTDSTQPNGNTAQPSDGTTQPADGGQATGSTATDSKPADKGTSTGGDAQPGVDKENTSTPGSETTSKPNTQPVTPGAGSTSGNGDKKQTAQAGNKVAPAGIVKGKTLAVTGASAATVLMLAAAFGALGLAARRRKG